MTPLKELISSTGLKDLMSGKNPMKEPSEHSRRTFLTIMAGGISGLVGVLFAIPLVGFIVGPTFRSGKGWNHWVPVGDLSQFPKGETRLGRYQNPNSTPADGASDTLPCWVRNIDGETFQVFAINCAHMECPVRWFPQSKLFMCPCHGGVYYENGAVAAGPPPRGLFEYKYKVVGNKLMIFAGQLPTLSTQASLSKPGNTPCLG